MAPRRAHQKPEGNQNTTKMPFHTSMLQSVKCKGRVHDVVGSLFVTDEVPLFCAHRNLP